MWFDAMLCLAVPPAARWTAVVVDRVDGAEYRIDSVRFRWRRSAMIWTYLAAERTTERHPDLAELGTVTYGVRPIAGTPKTRWPED